MGGERPGSRAMLRAWNAALEGGDGPVEEREPVEGKNKGEWRWRERVRTEEVEWKADSTPSPWWRSKSM